jgi:hypothetical protein
MGFPVPNSTAEEDAEVVVMSAEWTIDAGKVKADKYPDGSWMIFVKDSKDSAYIIIKRDLKKTLKLIWDIVSTLRKNGVKVASQVSGPVIVEGNRYTLKFWKWDDNICIGDHDYNIAVYDNYGDKIAHISVNSPDVPIKQIMKYVHIASTSMYSQ